MKNKHVNEQYVQTCWAENIKEALPSINDQTYFLMTCSICAMQQFIELKKEEKPNDENRVRTCSQIKKCISVRFFTNNIAAFGFYTI